MERSLPSRRGGSSSGAALACALPCALRGIRVGLLAFALTLVTAVVVKLARMGHADDAQDSPRAPGLLFVLMMMAVFAAWLRYRKYSTAPTGDNTSTCAASSGPASTQPGGAARRIYVGGRYLSTSSVGCVDSPIRVTQTSRLCNCPNILAALYASSSVSYRFIAKPFLADTSHPVTTPDTSQCFQIRTSFAAGSVGAAGLSVIDSLGRGIAVFPGTHHGLQGSARRASEGSSVLLGSSIGLPAA